MKLFNSMSYYQLSIIIFAMVIVLISYVMSQRFVKSVAEEEHKKVELWAEAIKILTQSEFEQGINFEFIHGVVESNTSVPCILMDESGAVLSTKNVDSLEINTPCKLTKRIRNMNKTHAPLEIYIPDEGYVFMYYDSSRVQQMLQKFPLVQLGAIALFVLLIVLIIGFSTRSEQNMVWVGMAKETAHQLGTPITSLLGWVALLKDREPDVARELEKDVVRLQKISTRFSKIGTKNDTQAADILDIARKCMEYMRERASKNIAIADKTNGLSAVAHVNTMLWEWVVENLIKNALDAIGREKGLIEVSAQSIGTKVILDITDNGRGMPSSLYRKIFKPGYTTKPRGWGLGLSLCRRIVEDHYRGKIYVLTSEMDKGTTIRIVMRRV